MMKLFTLGILVGMCGVAASAAESKQELTGKNTEVKFVGTKPDGKHEGGFKVLTGTITADGKELSKAKIEVEIDMDSLWSDDEKLTAHLKGPDFFGVKSNPKSKFVSTKLEKNGEGYNVTGDLTLNGKTKSITFPAKFAADDKGVTLKSDFKINRSDFGITYGKGKIDEEVKLMISVDGSKK